MRLAFPDGSMPPEANELVALARSLPYGEMV
jgi:hypothetical protein